MQRMTENNKQRSVCVRYQSRGTSLVKSRCVRQRMPPETVEPRKAPGRRGPHDRVGGFSDGEYLVRREARFGGKMRPAPILVEFFHLSKRCLREGKGEKRESDFFSHGGSG